MKMKSRPLMIGTVSALALSGTLFAQGAFAEDRAVTKADHMNGMAEKIATKFNVNKDEVKAVFDEDRAAREAKREVKEAERLNDAVSSGALTAAQQDLITAKRSEMKTKMNEIGAIEDESARKKAAMSARDDLKTWAEDNDIDMKWLHPGKGGHGGPRGGEGPGARLK